MRIIFILFFSLVLVGCVNKSEILINPPREITEKIQPYYASAVAFIRENEKVANEEGRVLTSEEQALARKIGIKDISSVRLIFVNVFPIPKDASLSQLCEQMGFNSSKMAGFTYGHAIYIRNQYSNSREILAHEMTHITQYEKLGVEGFVERYLLELSVVGYRNAPLELEAYKNGARFK